MRAAARSALFGTIALTFSLLLVSCGTAGPLSGNTGTNSGSGPTPAITAVAEQVNGVAPNRKQEVQFSEAMNPATINSRTFVVTDASGGQVPGTVTYDSAFNLALFQPNPAMETNQKYTATVTTGVQSAGGVALASAYSYSFTTRATTDTSPLGVLSIDPADGANCVSPTAQIVITFDEEPDASTITSQNITVVGPNGAIPVSMAMNVSATQVVLTPKSPLPSGSMTVTVQNVTDLADVPMTAPVTSTFSTGCNVSGGGTDTFVYVGNNSTPGTPKIEGFGISAGGTATPVPGSPFALAGESLAGSPNGKFLFGDTNGSNPGTGMEYDTYSVAADGSLSTASSTTQMASDPAGTSGLPPASIGWITTDRTGATLYSEQGNGGPDTGDQWIAEYSAGANGSLSLLGASGSNNPGPLTFTPDNHFGYYVSSAGTALGYPTLVSVSRNADGTLSNVAAYGPGQYPQPAGLPVCNPPSCDYPENATASPASNDLAVAFAGGQTEGIAVYPLNSSGSLGAPAAFLPLTTNSGYSAPWTLVWDSTGTYIFASDSGTIFEIRYDPLANTLSLVGTTVTATASFTPPDQMAFLNGHLFATNSTSPNLYIFNFSNGVLNPAPGSPVPLGFAASSLAALQR